MKSVTEEGLYINMRVR